MSRSGKRSDNCVVCDYAQLQPFDESLKLQHTIRIHVSSLGVIQRNTIGIAPPSIILVGVLLEELSPRDMHINPKFVHQNGSKILRGAPCRDSRLAPSPFGLATT